MRSCGRGHASFLPPCDRTRPPAIPASSSKRPFTPTPPSYLTLRTPRRDPTLPIISTRHPPLPVHRASPGKQRRKGTRSSSPSTSPGISPLTQDAEYGSNGSPTGPKGPSLERPLHNFLVPTPAPNSTGILHLLGNRALPPLHPLPASYRPGDMAESVFVL